MPKYKIFEGTNRKTGGKTVTVVSHYAGKPVRGIAKCNMEKDEYDLPNGIALAQARCDVKVAEKRFHTAQKKLELATKRVKEATEYLAKITDYVDDATREYKEAQTHLSDIENEMSK